MNAELGAAWWMPALSACVSELAQYGPWQFWAFNQGDNDSWATWTGAGAQCTQGQYSCTNGFGQDSGSTYASSGGPWWSAS